jgi:hypothetical protein
VSKVDTSAAAQNFSICRRIAVSVDPQSGAQAPTLRHVVPRPHAVQSPSLEPEIRVASSATGAQTAQRLSQPRSDRAEGRAQPDQPNRAYLKVIAHDPEGVARALTQEHLMTADDG